MFFDLNSVVYLASSASFIIVSMYFYFTWHYDYWRKRGLFHIKPRLFFGNVGSLMTGKCSVGEQCEKLYSRTEGHEVVGLYILRKPAVGIRDPDAIRTVLVRDGAEHFVDNSFAPDDDIEPLLPRMLFWMTGEKWRFFRENITPLFTIAKVKNMIPGIDDCGRLLVEVLDETAAKNQGRVNAEDGMRWFTVASIIFASGGIKWTRDSVFHKDVHRISSRILYPTLRRILGFLGIAVCPRLMKAFKLTVMEADMYKFFESTFNYIVDYRKANNIVVNDALDSLLKIKEVATKKRDDISEEKGIKRLQSIVDSKIELNELDFLGIVASVLVGSSESATTSLAFTLYELAMNPDCQERLREEIQDTLSRHKGEITYESLAELTYMEKCICESLRMHPIVEFISRTCTKDYKIPNTSVDVKKGMDAFVSIRGLHYDPKYYPDPEKYDPGRFDEEQKRSRHPCAYLPFGFGHRKCIGMQLVMPQMKIALVHVLSNFDVLPCKQTPPVPLKTSPKCLFAAPKEPIILKFVKRQN